ncbi:lysine-specific histone demethylase [Striga asiatica]|uniref:Lysine-specific histone demethylase n=1 Tax=Striga asiatica TaxID=4170 RepID=A0A5A7P1H5_STRAF|nr:lysine-specific histone demethylase [Striga asiatica]
MDEEKKMGLKRKSKLAETVIDSDDDEPIGTLLKKKGKKSSKKTKLIADVENHSKAIGKMTPENDELGGMDDTLAIFRKKLKGPKKNDRSAMAAGKESSSDVVESSGLPLDESVKDSELDLNGFNVLQKRCLDSTEDASSEGATVMEVLKLKAKKKNKRFIVNSDTMIAGNSESGKDVHPKKSGDDALRCEEKCTSESDRVAAEDSLSAFFQKMQTGKSHGSSKLKKGKKTRELNDGPKMNFSAGLESSVWKAKSDSTFVKKSVLPDERYSEVLNCTPGNASDLNKGIPVNDSSKENNSEESTSITVHGSSPSSLRQCPVKIIGVEEGGINADDVGDQPAPGSTNETPIPDNIFNVNDRTDHCMEPKDLETPVCESIENTCDDVKLDSCLDIDVDLIHSTQMQIEHPSGDHGDPVKVLDKFPEEELDLAPVSSEKVHEVVLQKSKDEPDRVDIEAEHVLEPSRASREGVCPPSCDSPESEGINGTSGSSMMVDHQGSYAEDPETKETSLSVGQRAARNARKQRHGDMAYEGDIDWEVLMQAPEHFVSHNKIREKLDSLSATVHAGYGKAAAVAAGLKARAAGSLEKIRFKEVLKRKGGIQEYLECRNHILSLWNKDVTRILQLANFGVSEAPLEGESKRDSLIRDIFAFLDQCGYINFGVPSEKENPDNCIKADAKLLAEEKHRDNSVPPCTNSKDGDAVVLGKDKISENSVSEKHADAFAEGNLAGIDVPENGHVNLKASKSTAQSVMEESSLDHTRGINSFDAAHLEKEASVGADNLDSIPSRTDENDKTIPDPQPVLFSPEQALCGRLSDSVDDSFSRAQNFSKSKKNIIVIGAGPAGLTAARHLQRQGFSVTVLEARSRVGGRVFTDRSSLSVPVDLGASIITGVEADVATERRPDPSSLICAQLGLELTVLNSDCPLYDTVTGERVPADLDEELEAEYNRLLDEMELLVAEKGESAMKMSLEEGLEYGLKRRRMAHSGRDYMEAIPVKSREASGLRPLERRVMDWHFAHLEYGCAALLQEVSLPNWNQDDVYGGFGGAHCMIKGGYSAIVESLAEGICIHLDHVVTEVTYNRMDCEANDKLHRKVKVLTSNGKEFSGDAVLVTVPLGCLKAESIKFSPSLPEWKYLSIKRLGFGVLNKVVLEFPEVFWDDTIDYFGATAENRDQRGRCFMFWNVKKTVGAPILIALVVGKAAKDGQSTGSSDNVSHALLVLRKLFGEDKVPNPVAAVVTDWGRDPYSYGAYSYVAVGSSGEDYDILGKPVENCLFFAGEATCKEHPDTVGGAMMSGLREAVRIIDIMNTGKDYIAEVEAMEAARRHSDIERSEVKDLIRRLDAVEFSNALYKKSLDGSRASSWGTMLKDMFFTAKTTAGRLHLAKELLNLPVGFLKTFASTKEGLSTLNTWILDSMGKDGTQLLRHCVRLLVLVSNDLAAVRLSGVGKTVKQKVCVHTSRDIRAIAFQLVRVWVELFRKEKASKGGLKLLRQSNSLDSKSKSSLVSGKPPLGNVESKLNSKASASAEHQLHSSTSTKKMDGGPLKSEARIHQNTEEDSHEVPMSEEEKAAFAAAEAARASAIAAAKALASSGARNASLQAPKILSFHKFAMRGQNNFMDAPDSRKHWFGGAIGSEDCLAEIDSRNSRVRDWSVDFTNEFAADCQSNIREHSGENVEVDSSFLTKAWVDSDGSVGIKDYSAIERWQCQAAAAASGFSHGTMHLIDEEESNLSLRKHEFSANESSASKVTMNNKSSRGSQLRGADRLKKAVVDYVASLLMPLYNAKKIDRDGYKSIMKKAATKVMEQTTDAEKAMAVHEFLDFKRKNKIRAFVDLLIERHKAVKPDAKA